MIRISPLLLTLVLIGCATPQPAPDAVPAPPPAPSEPPVPPGASISSGPSVLASPATAPENPVEVSLAITPAITGQTLTINGTTTLPDGYVLQISACRQHPSPEASYCTLGSENNPFQRINQNLEAIVSNGVFSVTFEHVHSVAEVQDKLRGYAENDRQIRESVGVEPDPNPTTGLYNEALAVDPFVTLAIVGDPGLQSTEVRSLIGSNGENLVGESVNNGVVFTLLEIEM